MKTFKIIFPLCIFHFACSISALAQWSVINSGVNTNLYKVQFVNDSTGFVSGYGGILKTVDRGNSWNNVYSGEITEMHFPSEQTGYAINWLDTGLTHKVFKTQDGGNNWFLVGSFTGTNNGVTALYFNDTLKGFVAEKNGGGIYRTTDGGVNLNSTGLLGTPSFLESFAFFTNQIGLVVGWYNGVIAKTIDGGISWQILTQAYQLTSIHAPSSNIAYAAGWYGTIIKTTNQGDSLIVQNTNLSTNTTLWSIYCHNTNTCYAAGDSGTIIKTTDGGNTWVKQSSGTIQKLYSIYCTDANTCYAAGDSGTILKTINGGVVGINDFPEKKNEIVVYPNPFSNQITVSIKYPLAIINLRMIIYDMLGKEVYQETLNSKLETLNIHLTSGFYYYELSNKNEVIGQGKLIIQKEN